ncbi:MAG: hypothetical protein FWG88_06505 [Oscillospiraceae bacterium]|nr:hypothetical protein [Oscillospiraceae bacterium]
MREINYEGYFWQSSKIRLRGVAEDDWELHYVNRFETPARLLLNYEVELPPTIKEAQQANGEYHDEILYGLTKDEFMSITDNLDCIDTKTHMEQRREAITAL